MHFASFHAFALIIYAALTAWFFYRLSQQKLDHNQYFLIAVASATGLQATG